MQDNSFQTPTQPASDEEITRVVNIFTSAYDCYIGGPHNDSDPREFEPGQIGFLGNPFREGSLEHRLACFEEYFEQRMKTDRRFFLAVLSLRGKRLGCVCEDERCHGEIIAEWLDRHESLYRAYNTTPSTRQLSSQPGLRA